MAYVKASLYYYSVLLQYLLIISLVPSLSSSANIRLVNGYRNSSEYLEVMVSGASGTVAIPPSYARNFQATAARVACKQLGYTDPVRWGSYLYSNVTDFPW